MGLQPERTLLSWSRTSMLMAINAVLLLRSGPVITAFPFIVMLLIIALFVISYRKKTLLMNDNNLLHGSFFINLLTSLSVAYAAGVYIITQSKYFLDIGIP